MSSLTRLLSVLDLFSARHVRLTAEEIASELRLSRTTCYRYLRELLDTELLVSDAGVHGLGPRILELDLRMRQTEPLVVAGQPVLRGLVEETGAIGVLAALYGERIFNVCTEVPVGQRAPSHDRGAEVPPVRSASSRAIVAKLSPVRQKRVWRKSAVGPAALALDWPAFRDSLERVRHRGFEVSRGELDAGLDGVAAPVSRPDGRVAGSVALLFERGRLRLWDENALGDALMEAAEAIGGSTASA